MNTFALAKTVGKNIRFYRENLCMSYADLSELTDIPVSAIRSYEDGAGVPPLWNLVLISQALDVPLDALVYDLASEQ